MHLLLSAMAAAAIEIPHEQYQLDNGLTVILHQDRSLPQVVVNLWYDVGSQNEEPGRSGFAHLFEHLMFMGTARLPDSGFDDLMEAHGGWNNAWTSEDATDYYDVGPSNLLATLLWMEADRMDGLAAAMTQEKLDLQREVVRNERRQSYEDAPYGEVWLTMPAMMYPAEHPYAESVIGSHEDLQAATVEDVVAFFNTWYVPNNASLVVAGDFDSEEIKPLIARLFGGMERSELPAEAAVQTPDVPVTPLVELTDAVQIPMSVMLWHSPAVLQPGDAALDVVSAILSDGRASRLYQRLIHEEGAALEAEASQYSQQLSSLFVVELKPAEDHSLEELEDIVLEEIDRLASEGPTEAELERVQNQLEMSFLRRLESLQGRASQLNRYYTLTGDPGFLQADLDRYRNLTAAEVQAAAAALTPERMGRIRVYPEPSEGGEE